MEREAIARQREQAVALKPRITDSICRLGRMLDCGGIYAEGRSRLVDIARTLTVQEEAVVVPACPEWTVHDVFAHLVGACADVRAGRTEGITTSSWANRQARDRRGRTMAELLEEWSVEAPLVEAAVSGAPDPMPILWVLDQAAHEQDIRGATDRPGARDAPGLFAALDMLVVDGLGTQLRQRGLGTLRVSTPERAWTVGRRGRVSTIGWACPSTSRRSSCSEP